MSDLHIAEINKATDKQITIQFAFIDKQIGEANIVMNQLLWATLENY